MTWWLASTPLGLAVREELYPESIRARILEVQHTLSDVKWEMEQRSRLVEFIRLRNPVFYASMPNKLLRSDFGHKFVITCAENDSRDSSDDA